MRLISTSSQFIPTQEVHFEEFFDNEIPKYAILSHRWGNDEVSFKELRKGQAFDGSDLSKIKEFCDKAAEHGFEWAWVDTCCIDKRSSAELTEAVSSMYKWYKHASVCYVHLKDLKNESDVSFVESEWFKRGWTLQELLAPTDVQFYNDKWIYLGSKDDMFPLISTTTGIPSSELAPAKGSILPFDKSSVAMKMSWAAGRRTSRAEDRAYSLMGLFDVNMPLLYGEGGPKAFQRLQLEILKTTSDESIFAFEIAPGYIASMHRSILAPTPDLFKNAGNIVYYPRERELKRWYIRDYRNLEMEIAEADILDFGPGGSEHAGSSLVILLECYERSELFHQLKANATLSNASTRNHIAIRISRFDPDQSYMRKNSELEYRKRPSSASSKKGKRLIRLRVI